VTLDLSETFVFDAVTHAYNVDPSNFRNERHASVIAEMLFGTQEAFGPAYHLDREEYFRDWGIEETAGMLFAESQTDMATFHPTPVTAFEDGLVSVEKAERVAERYPDRFEVFATVDPLADDALESIEAQAAAFDPVGLKLYPSTWGEDTHDSWRMDDPEVAFPVFERAADLGIDLVAVHKAQPLGPVPMDPYDPRDIDQAATSFPDIDFSIVHGGVAFVEEIAWQLARYDNIYVNLEGLPILLVGNERAFAESFAGLLSVGGEIALEQIYWSSAAMAAHPQPQLEAFAEFQIPEEVRKANGGSSGALPSLTDDHKRAILGENYADLLGIDVDAARERVDGDEFDQRRASGLAEPYATTEVAGD